MTASDLQIRNAVASDADAMGLIHVRAWQSAYRGVMPDAYLDGLVAEERAAMWRPRLSRDDLPPLLVAERNEVVIGFASFGSEQPSPHVIGAGQVHAINVEPTQWRQGAGRALLLAATAALAEQFATGVLWVVPENTRARSLYEAEGWREDGTTASVEVLGVVVTEMRYRRALRP